jgi:hypothetical protein
MRVRAVSYSESVIQTLAASHSWLTSTHAAKRLTSCYRITTPKTGLRLCVTFAEVDLHPRVKVAVFRVAHTANSVVPRVTGLGPQISQTQCVNRMPRKCI